MTQRTSLRLCLALAMIPAACGDDDASDVRTVVSVETQIDRTTILVAETATVACSALDGRGIAIDGLSYTVTAAPTSGLALDGLVATAQAAGEYELACITAGVADLTPATLTVTDPTPIADATAPVITLTAPERGSATATQTQVEVVGTVVDDLSEVTSLTVNGAAVTPSPEDGAFSATVDLAYAITFIEVVATDAAGNTQRVTRAVERSTAFFAMSEPTMATDGAVDAVVLMLGQAAVDDGDHDEAVDDDLAAAFRTVLRTVRLGTLLPSPLLGFACEGGDCALIPIAFTTTDRDVTLTLKDGKIGVQITLDAPSLQLVLLAPCRTNTCSVDPVALAGSVTAASITITADLVIHLDDGAPTATAEGVVISVGGQTIAFDDPDTQASAAVGTAMTALTDGLEGVLAPVWSSLIEGQMTGLMDGLLQALAYDLVFELPPVVEGTEPTNLVIETRPSAVDITPERIRIVLDGLAFSQSPLRPAQSLGSIDRVGCAPKADMAFTAADPLAIGLHDDLLNQLLFAVWEGGTLDLDLGPTETAPLVDGTGITDMALRIEMRLPPVFNTCRADGAVLQVSEMFVDATFKLVGEPASFALWLQTEAPVSVELGVNDKGASNGALVLGDLAPFTVEFIRNTGFFDGNEQALIELLRNELVPLVLATAIKTARFDLPNLALGEIAEGLPSDTVIDLNVETVGRDGGYLTLKGRLN